MSGQAIVTFGNSVPGAQKFAEVIAHSPNILALNKAIWLFSLVEITHLLFLVAVGGATLVLALRTLGVTLVEVTPAEVESITRPWLYVGAIGGIASGIFMSIATALTLIGNTAFVVKMLALVAAILFSLALAGRLRGGDPALQKGFAVVGLLLLSLGIWLFVSTRILFFGSVLLGVVSGTFLLLAFIARARNVPNEKSDRFAQLLAIGTVVAWSTVTLGGRWIGFS